MRTFKLVVVALGALAGASGCGGGSGPDETSEPAASGPLLEPCMSAPAPEPVSQAESSSVICHIPPGNHENAHTLAVDAAAVSAHLAHGDSLGPCGSPPPPGACCPGLACLTHDFIYCTEDAWSECNCSVLLQ